MAPRKSKKSQLARQNFTFPAELLEAFRRVTKARDETMSQVVRRAMREYVAEHDEKNGEAA